MQDSSSCSYTVIESQPFSLPVRTHGTIRRRPRSRFLEPPMSSSPDWVIAFYNEMLFLNGGCVISLHIGATHITISLFGCHLKLHVSMCAGYFVHLACSQLPSKTRGRAYLSGEELISVTSHSLFKSYHALFFRLNFQVSTISFTLNYLP